jgi:hypothetical protein
LLDETFAPCGAATHLPERVTVRVRFAPPLIRWVRERQHFGFVVQEGDVMQYAVSDPFAMLP